MYPLHVCRLSSGQLALRVSPSTVRLLDVEGPFWSEHISSTPRGRHEVELTLAQVKHAVRQGVLPESTLGLLGVVL